MASRGNADYIRVLDAIYASFMARKSAVEGRPDREVRDPRIILDLADKLGLTPDPDIVIKVTGSKGKGTVARMIARLLEAHNGENVGLFVSPEEIDHNDRMRFDGRWPDREQFVGLYQALAPALGEAERRLPKDRYLSPMGTFLLVALKYFQDCGAEYLVLECGRGSAYDEVGNLASKGAVVTSILPEHTASLGPGIEEIARNKLHIGTNAEFLVCDQSIATRYAKLGVAPEDRLILAGPPAENPAMPDWIEADKALAKTAAARMLGKPLWFDPPLDDCSAAFGLCRFGQNRIYFDACVSAASLDTGFLDRLREAGEAPVILASLPDDKDGAGIREAVGELGLPFAEIALSGTRGYLHYDQAKAEDRLFAEIAYEDRDGLRRACSKLTAKHDTNTLYTLGTQTFIRLVKRTFAEDADQGSS